MAAAAAVRMDEVCEASSERDRFRSSAYFVDQTGDTHTGSDSNYVRYQIGITNHDLPILQTPM